MEEMATIRDILKFAIGRECQAAEFYMAIAESEALVRKLEESGYVGQT